jgi:hypothetical protein
MLQTPGPERMARFEEHAVVELSHLPAGNWDWVLLPSLGEMDPLSFLDRAHDVLNIAEGSIEIQEGEVAELEIAVGPPERDLAQGTPAHVFGRIEVDGRPARGYRVELYAHGAIVADPLQAETDALGEFDLGQVPPGWVAYQVAREEARARPGRRAARNAKTFETVQVGTLQLEPGEERELELVWTSVVLEITVVGKESGRAVPDASVSLASEGHDPTLTSDGATDASGRLEIQTFHAGSFLARAIHATEGIGKARAEIPAGASRVAVVIELGRGVPCAGRVVAPEFAPSADSEEERFERIVMSGDQEWTSQPGDHAVLLRMMNLEDPAIQAATLIPFATGEGTFELVGLVPGRYLALLWSPELGLESANVEVELGEAGSRSLELVFEPEREPAEGR